MVDSVVSSSFHDVLNASYWWSLFADIGDAYLGKRDFAHSVASYRTALRLKPEISMHGNMAVGLLNMGKTQQAHMHFTLEAIRNPSVESYQNLAAFFTGENRIGVALKVRQQGMNKFCPRNGAQMQCVPMKDFNFIYEWWDIIQQTCGYHNEDDAIDFVRLWSQDFRLMLTALQSDLDADNPGISPIQSMRFPLDNDQRLAVAVATAAQTLKQLQAANRVAFHPSHSVLVDAFLPSSKIHIGYFAYTFSPTRELNGLVTGLFSHHDRSRFQITCFSLYGHHPKDSVEDQQRIVREVDLFEVIPYFEDDDVIASKINQHKVHVLVDVIGLLPHNRNKALGLKPAPIQMVMVYAATTGCPWIDYFVNDRVTSTPELAPVSHSEKMVYLPYSHFVNNQAEYLPSEKAFRVVPTRTEFGLEENDGYLLAALNAFHKFEPKTFYSWMRIAERLGPSTRILIAKFPYWEVAQKNILGWAQKYSNDGASRLVFLNKTATLLDHVRRATLASVFLDTRYYNAHTLAVDMMWAGLPIISNPGTTLTSRVSTSLLLAAGQGHLIARTTEDYEDLAVAMARKRTHHPEPTDSSEMHKNPAFDQRRWTENLERAIVLMWDLRIAADGEKKKNIVLSY